MNLKLKCFDTDAVLNAALAAAEKLQISREMYMRARAASSDDVSFDIKALITLTSPVDACDVTVESIRRCTSTMPMEAPIDILKSIA
ncbi:hypothetical protein [Hartmannibacter diazotrophicus]|uniref:hypothetical protein n=1 Tax=Hartmannibacter diazotrophicus TaxID=1482074 RepID=UPI0012FE1AA1|nr:hypothetical protein [Hartmannibacter diazotrophicus]